jgi:hypothetical protein
LLKNESSASEYRWLVFVKYLDHVLYNRAAALAMQPQVRQAVGWLVYECNLYVTIAWDHDSEPTTLCGGDSKASGMVLLKSDILDLQKLPIDQLLLQKNSECHLNLEQTTVKTEYALQSKKAKNSMRRDSK